MALRCQKSPIPFICSEAVAEQCLYCGKHFCAKHGNVSQAACNALLCQINYKRDSAVTARETWEHDRFTIGQERNRLGWCAQPECQNAPYIPCGNCEEMYCSEHVKQHSFSYVTYTRRQSTRLKGDIVLCEVCKPYLNDYKRDRYE